MIDSSVAAHEGGNTAPQRAFPSVFPLWPEGNAYQSRSGRRSGPRTIHSPRDRRSMLIAPRPPRDGRGPMPGTVAVIGRQDWTHGSTAVPWPLARISPPTPMAQVDVRDVKEIGCERPPFRARTFVQAATQRVAHTHVPGPSSVMVDTGSM